jgi:transitional endoplasmic reticulum ATPase
MVGTIPHDEIADRTESWSAAELTAIWTEAALLAVKDSRSAIHAEDYVGGYQRVAQQRHRIVVESAAT